MLLTRSLRWMVTLYENGFSGILADEMVTFSQTPSNLPPPTRLCSLTCDFTCPFCRGSAR